jgi:hypothetical protein
VYALFRDDPTKPKPVAFVTRLENKTYRIETRETKYAVGDRPVEYLARSFEHARGKLRWIFNDNIQDLTVIHRKPKPVPDATMYDAVRALQLRHMGRVEPKWLHPSKEKLAQMYAPPKNSLQAPPRIAPHVPPEPKDTRFYFELSI